MDDVKQSSGRTRLGSTLFRLTVGFALLLAARSLFVELPMTPSVRRLISGDVQDPALQMRKGWEGAIRHLPREGNIFVQFRLSADDMSAADAYFNWIYLLYPRKVYVTMKPRVVNDSQDLAESAAPPEIGWLHEHGVSTTLLVDRNASGQLRIQAASPDSPFDR